MRIKLLTTALGACALAAVAIPALGAAGVDDPKLIAKPMDGAQEVPDPGDDDGKGNAKLTLKSGKTNEICFVIKFKNIEDPTAAHIHKGVEGKDGDIVVELFTDTQDESPVKDCIEEFDGEPLSDKLLKQLEAKPEKFYVNIHNDEYPDGAIRGQLAGADSSADEEEK